MKKNNIKLKLPNGKSLFIAQHYDENGLAICEEIAVVDAKGINDPVPYCGNLSDFMKALMQALQGAMK